MSIPWTPIRIRPNLYRMTYNCQTADRTVAQKALGSIATIADEVTGRRVDRLFTRELDGIFTGVIVFSAESDEEADEVVKAVRRLPELPELDSITLKRR